MSRTRSSNRLQQGVERLGLDLSGAQLAQMERYLDELERWNSAYNLTAVRDREGMVQRHLLDALSALPDLVGLLSQPGARVLDVGSGAGVPGLIWAIACPEVAVTVLDSNGKKARFLRHAVRSLGLSRASVAECRVEDHDAPEGYTLITSRAFSALDDFFAATRPLLAPGGQWAAMKGKLDDRERAGLPEDVEIEAFRPLRVPGLDEARHLVMARPRHSGADMGAEASARET